MSEMSWTFLNLFCGKRDCSFKRYNLYLIFRRKLLVSSAFASLLFAPHVGVKNPFPAHAGRNRPKVGVLYAPER